MSGNSKTHDEATQSPGRPKDTHKHAQILRAGAQLYVEKGYEGTSMDEVAKRAGVSKQTVYSHFKNKDGLFSAAVRYFTEQIIPFDVTAPSADKSVEDTLQVIGRGFVDLIMSDKSMAVNRMITAPGADAKRLAQMFYEAGPKVTCDSLEVLIKRWHRQKKLKAPNANLAVHQLISLLKGEPHFMRSFGLIDEPSDKEKNKHVRQSIAAFMKIYGV